MQHGQNSVTKNIINSILATREKKIIFFFHRTPKVSFVGVVLRAEN